MSGTLADLLAQPRGIDVLSPLQKWADLSGRYAQTGLTQQQGEQVGLANQLSRLQLGIRGQIAGAVGVPGAPQGAPQGGAPSGGTSYLPGAPQGAPQGGAPSGGTSYLPGVGGAPAQPAAAGGGLPVAASDAVPDGAPAQSVSPAGVMSPYGVPIPKLRMLAALAAPDMQAGIHQAMEDRRVRLVELLGQGPQGIKQAYQEGWLDVPGAQALLQNPNVIPRAIEHLQSPSEYTASLQRWADKGVARGADGTLKIDPTMLAARSATAEAEASGRNRGDLPLAGTLARVKAAGGELGGLEGKRAGDAPGLAGATAGAVAKATGEMREIKIDNGDGTFSTRQVPATEAAAFLGANRGAKPATSADFMDPSITVSPQVYASRSRSFENGGGAADATNPRSSATGDHQFTADTWLDTVKAAKPAWASGKTDAQLLAFRSDPGKSAEMGWAYAQQNAPRLQAAGVPVNTLTLGMAHFLGPGDIQKVMAADPATPMSQIMSPAVLAANPEMRKQTAGDVMGKSMARYGMNKVDPSQAWGTNGTGPVAGVSSPTLGTLGDAKLGVTTKTIDKDAEAAAASLDGAQGAQKIQTNLLQARNLVPQINAGAGADTVQRFQNVLATWAPEAAQKFIAGVTAGKIDPSKAGATQEIVKLTLQQAGAQEQAALGKNSGYQALTLYQKANPNIEMQDNAMMDMFNVLLVSHQRDVDYGVGRNQHFMNSRRDFLADSKGGYNPLGNFDQDFARDNPPQVYAGAMAALNGKLDSPLFTSLSKPQQKAALAVMWRADPSAKLGPFPPDANHPTAWYATAPQAAQ